MVDKLKMIEYAMIALFIATTATPLVTGLVSIGTPVMGFFQEVASGFWASTHPGDDMTLHTGLHQRPPMVHRERVMIAAKYARNFYPFFIDLEFIWIAPGISARALTL